MMILQSQKHYRSLYDDNAQLHNKNNTEHSNNNCIIRCVYRAYHQNRQRVRYNDGVKFTDSKLKYIILQY